MDKGFFRNEINNDVKGILFSIIGISILLASLGCIGTQTRVAPSSEVIDKHLVVHKQINLSGSTLKC